MRSAVVLAALAAGAMAVPFGHRHHKRDIKTDYDIVVTTAVVYVTAGEPAPTSAAAPAPSVADVTTTVAPVPSSTSVAVSVHEDAGSSSSKKHHQKPSPVAPSSAAPSVVVITTVVGPQAPSSTYVPPPAPTSTVEASPVVQSSPAPQSPAPQSPAPEAPSTGSSAPATSYQEIVVLHHNLHRRNHSAPDIQWSDNLAQSAAMVAATCNYNHNMGMMGGGYGQNIAAGVDSQNVSSVITDLFYNGEVNNYNGLYGQAQPSMDNFDAWGHFSQIVWKATTAVGCATQYCPNGLANTGSDVEPYFTVCNYGPEGNMANGYGANIGSPLGMPTAQWNTGL